MFRGNLELFWRTLSFPLLAAIQHEANVQNQVFHDVNVIGTKNLLDAYSYSRAQRFVHGSTISVYGNLEPGEAVNKDIPANDVALASPRKQKNTVLKMLSR